MKKAVIFDFDGVLCDTFEFHRKHFCTFLNRDVTPEEFCNFHNGSVFDNKTSIIVKDEDWPRYHKLIMEDIEKFPIKKNIIDVLKRLKNDYDLFIISSAKEEFIKKNLEHNKIDYLFKEVYGCDAGHYKDKKFNLLFDTFDLTKDDCIFITDTLSDVIEAKKVGVNTVAVSFGFHDINTLKLGKPYKIISDFQEIVNLADYLLKKEKIKINN